MPETVRRKRCHDCAFNPNSPERADPVAWDNLMLSMCYRTFICHQTMFRLQNANGSTEYDPKRNNVGIAVDPFSHKICAGWNEVFGHEKQWEPLEITSPDTEG